MIEKIPLSRPDICALAEKSLMDTLRSGWLTQGPMVARFEATIAGMMWNGEDGISPPHCVAVSSATAGLHLALEARNIGPGARVAVPTWTFTATAHAVELTGAKPVFIDVDPETLNITEETVYGPHGHCNAVIPVHMAGHPIDMHRLSRFDDTIWIEDCAHAITAAYPRANPPPAPIEMVGNAKFADACVFSFYATKPLTTGEGGMIVTRDGDLADRLRRMRYHGLDVDAHTREAAGINEFDVVSKGYKYNMSDLSAAIGFAQCSRAPRELTERRHVAEQYLETLAGTPLQLPPNVPGHCWHLFIVQCRDLAQRMQLAAHLAALGIATGIHYRPLHRTTYWREKYDLKAGDFPGAEAAADRVLSLPIYGAMPISARYRVCDAITAFFTGRSPRRHVDMKPAA